MRQSPLLSLSLELILLICDQLDHGDDMKALRLTCKSLAEGLASLVLRHIDISSGEATTYSEVISDLEFLSQPNNPFARCTREITIGFLSIDEVPIMENEERMRAVLLKAAISLKNVDTVTWVTGLDDELDSEVLQEIIWDTILSLGPNLLDLDIAADSLEVPLRDIELLTKLESITFSSIPVFGAAPVTSAVSKLYFSSSTLESIIIRKKFSTLSSLVPCSSHMPSGPPSLRRLDLTNFFIPFDEPITLSRLSNLTSFKYSISSAGPDPKYSPDNLWMALKAAEIQLEELDLGEGAIAASLVDYLSTFSGLKKLRLDLVCSTLPTGTAAQFWSTAFPNHANTLEDFSLYACDEIEWCFSEHNCSFIVQCTKLKFLGLTILCQPEDVLLRDLTLVIAKSLIDMAVTDLPCLEHLHLQVAGLTGPREGVVRWILDEAMICHWLPKYEPPTSCRYLPWLSVGGFGGLLSDSRLFGGTRNGDMKLAYEEDDVDSESSA